MRRCVSLLAVVLLVGGHHRPDRLHGMRDVDLGAGQDGVQPRQVEVTTATQVDTAQHTGSLPSG